MATDKNIYVTQPYLPPLKEFIPYLEDIWKSKILTNGGKYHQELEKALSEYLGVKYVSLFNNGTVALMTALKALTLSGEVITTPYSFAATSHSILWNGLKPVFVDIDLNTMNLNPFEIEKAITPKTSAIMPVHCYGYPCETSEIKRIADQYNLKVVYDAAHAFGIGDDTGSILNHGDLSVLSFHATKVFNTFEGGAIVSSTLQMKQKIDNLRNFGYESPEIISEFGLNGKMSEINAAFGLLQLKYVDEAIGLRSKIDAFYREKLKNLSGIKLPPEFSKTKSNFSYFPIRVTADYPLTRNQLHDLLLSNGIVTRKYFHPLISDFEIYSHLDSSHLSNLPCATKVSSEILCLPIYPSLDMDKMLYITNTLQVGGNIE